MTRHDGRKITLPDKNNRQYHRISVSLGGKRRVPLKWGDFGNGYLHLCDEISVGILFGELDTITDFVNFLVASEELHRGGTLPFFSGGGIEDLLSIYIRNGQSFSLTSEADGKPDLLLLTNDFWTGYEKSNERMAGKKDLQQSYVWDRLIAVFVEDLLTDEMFDMFSKQVTENELALVSMALQPRAHRANLAEAFIEFIGNPKLKIASRVVVGANNTAFVFLVGPSSERTARAQELALRCLVIRGRVPDITTVVGIATDRPGGSKIGYSLCHGQGLTVGSTRTKMLRIFAGLIKWA